MRSEYAALQDEIDQQEDVCHEATVALSKLENLQRRALRRGLVSDAKTVQDISELRQKSIAARKALRLLEVRLSALANQLIGQSVYHPLVQQPSFYPGELGPPNSKFVNALSLPVDPHRSWKHQYTQKVLVKETASHQVSTALFLKSNEHGESTRQECVVKRYRFDSPEQKRQFQTEIEILGQLSHPYILKPECLFDMEKKSSVMYFSFAPRGNVQQWIANEKPSPVRLRRLFSRISNALSYLHSKAVVHGDLTLNNVLVGDGDQPLLIDFDDAQLH